MIDSRAVRQRLIDDAAVSSLVGERVTWGPPQSSLVAPCLWFSIISFSREDTFTGAGHYDRTLIDMHVITSDAVDHTNLMNHVIAAFDKASYTAHGTEVKEVYVDNIVQSSWEEDDDHFHSIITLQFTT